MNTPMWLLRLVFNINVVILVLLLFSFAFIEPGSGSYVVAMLTLGTVVFMLAAVTVTVLVDRRLSGE